MHAPPPLHEWLTRRGRLALIRGHPHEITLTTEIDDNFVDSDVRPLLFGEAFYKPSPFVTKARAVELEGIPIEDLTPHRRSPWTAPQPGKPTIISIEGNIGIGKSTLIASLRKARRPCPL